MAKLKDKPREVALTNQTEIKVRFSEVDAMRIVWHGEYVRYFEDGREAFGRQFEGLSYMDIFNSGYTTPIVDMKLEFKTPLTFGEEAIVKTCFINVEAAKICFDYTIIRKSDGAIAAIGSSIQVFLNQDFELELTAPEFFINWKKRWGLM